VGTINIINWPWNLEEGGMRHKKGYLYTGRFSSLEERFLSSLREKKEADPLHPILVLVGSNLLHLHLRRKLALVGCSHINVRFLTLLDLAHELGGPVLEEKGLRPLPPLADLLQVVTLVKEMKSTNYFFPLKEFPGFPRALLSTFHDLLEAGLKSIPHPASRRQEDLQSLYGRYLQIKERGFYLEDDLFCAAAERVGNLEEKFDSPDVIIYGFYDFNLLQRRLLGAIIGSYPVEVYLPLGDGGGYEYARRAHAFFLGFPLKECRLEASRKEGSLGHLQEKLFQQPGVPAPGDGRVEIIGAPSDADEVRECIRAVLAEVDEKLRTTEVGVLLRNEDHFRLFSRELKRFGIPHYLSSGRKLGEYPAVRGALALLEIIASDWRGAEVLDLLTSTVWRASSGENEEVARVLSTWEKIVAEAGIIGGKGQWRERLHLYLGKLRNKLAGLKDRSREGEAEEGPHLKKSEKDILELVKGTEALLVRVNKLMKVLDGFPLEASWGEYVEEFISAIGSLFREDEALQRLKEGIEALSPLDEVASPVKLETFSFFVKELTRTTVAPAERFQLDGINLLEVMEARGILFPLVVIPGLTDQAYPSRPGEDPLLLDCEREAINRSLGENVLALKRERVEEERMLFRLMVDSAERKLVLSHSRWESLQGKRRAPSPFLVRVAAVLAGSLLGSGGLEQVSAYRRSCGSDLFFRDGKEALNEAEFRIFSLASSLKDGNARETGRSILSFLPFYHPYFRWRRALLDGKISPFEGRIGKHLSFQLCCPESRETLPPSAIETLAFCPYAYFLRHLLGLEKTEEAEAVIYLPPRDRGAIVHQILHLLYRRLQREGGLPLSGKTVKRVLEVLRDVCSEVWGEREKLGGMGLPLFWEAEKERIHRDLSGFLIHEAEEESELFPLHFEYPFGEGDEGRRLELSLSGGRKISFRGRIDRIDVDKSCHRFRVVDYKTGGFPEGRAYVEEGKRLQIPTYLLAAKKELDLPPETVMEGVLQSTRNQDDYRALSLKVDDEGELADKLRDVIERLLNLRDEGCFPPSKDKEACRYCDYEWVCPLYPLSVWERKRQDPDFTRYAEIQRIRWGREK
jgi:ATP-dependent helicase/DNAse subunit B